MTDPAGPGLVERCRRRMETAREEAEKNYNLYYTIDFNEFIVKAVLAEFLAALGEPAMVEKLAGAMYERRQRLAWERLGRAIGDERIRDNLDAAVRNGDFSWQKFISAAEERDKRDGHHENMLYAEEIREMAQSLLTAIGREVGGESGGKP